MTNTLETTKPIAKIKKKKKGRGPGRPPGSKNKKRGRPPGSKNKKLTGNWLDNINALGKQLEKELLAAVERLKGMG